MHWTDAKVTLSKVVNRKTSIVLFSALLVAFGAYYLLLRPTDRHIPSKEIVSKPAISSVTPKIQLALVATGLPDPTGIVATGLPGDDRLFILDRSGVVRIIKDGVVLNNAFLDINDKVTVSAEMGLLGLAFSPHYTTDGNFFINYIDKSQNTTIARYHVSIDKDKADPVTGQVLLTLKQPYENHNGGDLMFGADGYLYIGLGDGGGAGDPENRAQNMSVLFGKILRLDVSQIPYKIPPTNPFVNQAGTAPEVWDYGLRNPWRFSFDRQTHELYIADVGQGTTEEIDVEAKNSGGNNYGWRCFEGTKDYNLDGCKTRSQYTFPVLEYDHSQGRCSTTGGYVYRGQEYPTIIGKYFYGDYCSGSLYSAEKQKGQWQSTLVAKSPYKISTFGEDNRGELYIADFSTGSIYHIQVTTN